MKMRTIEPRSFDLKTIDPRVIQIALLGGFLVLGVLARDFEIRWQQVALTFAAAIAAQALWLHRLELAGVGYLSAIVTSFGVSILVRADSLWVHPLVAALAISSKFVLRVDARHVFNPANLGAVLAAWVLPGAWVSPGQWGADLAAGAWFLAMGSLVTGRARRVDAGWCFLAFFLAFACARVLVLGQPLAVIANQAGNGALLLFAFFMISDPMTTPVHRRARIAYCALVASAAFCWQYLMFAPHALVTTLFLLSPTVVWFNRKWPATQYRWRQPASRVRRDDPATGAQAARACAARAVARIGPVNQRDTQ
jgi:Na+-transporting NADH:ubiquinone oxidoreductase subunit NqrB